MHVPTCLKLTPQRQLLVFKSNYLHEYSIGQNNGAAAKYTARNFRCISLKQGMSFVCLYDVALAIQPSISDTVFDPFSDVFL